MDLSQFSRPKGYNKWLIFFSSSSLPSSWETDLYTLNQNTNVGYDHDTSKALKVNRW